MPTMPTIFHYLLLFFATIFSLFISMLRCLRASAMLLLIWIYMLIRHCLFAADAAVISLIIPPFADFSYATTPPLYFLI